MGASLCKGELCAAVPTHTRKFRVRNRQYELLYATLGAKIRAANNSPPIDFVAKISLCFALFLGVDGFVIAGSVVPFVK